MLWWRTRRAPSAGGSFHTGASSQRSRPVPRPVVLTNQRSSLGAVDRAADIPCSLAGTMGFPFTPGYLQIQASLSSGFCFGRTILALVRPAVPYTLVLLLSALGRWCLGQYALLQRCPYRPVASQAFYRRVTLHTCCSTLLLKLEVPQNPK